MIINIEQLHPQFIIDENGQRKSVVLLISDFQELIHNLENLAVVAQRKEEPTTHLLQKGIDIRTISELLGHKNLQTTMIYTHIMKELNQHNIKSPLDF